MTEAHTHVHMNKNKYTHRHAHSVNDAAYTPVLGDGGTLQNTDEIFSQKEKGFRLLDVLRMK